MIGLTCPGCGRKLSVNDEFAGKKGICPHCKQQVQIPAASTDSLSSKQQAAPVAEPTLAASPRGEDATLPPSGSPASFGGLSAGEDVTLPPSEHPATPPYARRDGLDFLAPPQGPGELGRLGSYRVLKVLGEGGMGMVLVAEDPLLKRSVALKVMRPELAAQADARQRFLREAQATAAIEHPHIVHVYQVGEDRGVPFLAMPLLKGEPLDERLKREKKLPIAEVIHLGRQIAEGLAAAHKNGLIHRDIKPGNLWLESQDDERGATPRSWVKILDFGLARAVKGDDGQLTKSGAILGTPAYMAPEQARGEKVDGRCDLFSLGGVLYRILTGEMPFKGNDTMSLLMALATEDPRPVSELVPDVPPALADLIERLLSKDPEQRPASARVVADALAGMEGDRTQRLPAPAAPAPARKEKKTKSRWLLPAAGGGLLLALLVVGAIVSLRPSGGEKPPLAPPDSGGEKPPLVLPDVAPPPEKVKGVANSIGMKLVPIEPGKFWMGSAKAATGRGEDEHRHEVVVSKPFSIGVHEVTVGQFAAFARDAGYKTEAEKTGAGSWRSLGGGKWKQDPAITWKTPGFAQTDEHPVVCVSWRDATAFCGWLSKKEGNRYALPTEAQWEYCCRAGSRTRFSFGNNETDLPQYAWAAENAGKQTHPVGQKKPNAWGLYDMHGNAFEWCRDWYAADLLKLPPRGKGSRPPKSTKRVLRGGGWTSDPTRCRSAVRFAREPDLDNTNVGFRVVLLPEEVLTNRIGMKLKLIGMGKFTMGSPPSEPGRNSDEQEHEVTITRPFYLGVYPVTVGQFKAFVKDQGFQTAAEKGQGANRLFPDNNFKRDPAIHWRNPGFAQTDEHPVVCVTLNDAKEFCAWLSKKEGKRYVLPTEAQWEYACRAGSRTRFFFGDDERKLGEYAWMNINAKNHTHPVGMKKPNAWGLFDMIGNANQRMSDWYGANYYKRSPGEDPPGPGEGTTTVVRGGGWAGSADNGRSAWRFGRYSRGGRSTNTGFRVVLLW